ncbi:hypothetical protein KCP77_03655 [Salmonella enterica subsp. enterica]|nr:hypothetical protein KCP77_03655 [Salmonella enterica subsp. enterica]
MLDDSLPDAALPFGPTKANASRSARRRRGQFVRGSGAGAYLNVREGTNFEDKMTKIAGGHKRKETKSRSKKAGQNSLLEAM